MYPRISFLVLLLMAVLVLTGCGGGTDSANKADPVTRADQSQNYNALIRDLSDSLSTSKEALGVYEGLLGNANTRVKQVTDQNDSLVRENQKLKAQLA